MRALADGKAPWDGFRIWPKIQNRFSIASTLRLRARSFSIRTVPRVKEMGRCLAVWQHVVLGPRLMPCRANGGDVRFHP